MSKTQIDMATLIRIERTAGLVRSVVEQTFAHLRIHTRPGGDPDAWREHAAAPGEHLEGATAAVAMLASHVLGSLFIMCELITQNSNPTPEIRAKFAHILSRRAVDHGPVVDLRLQRLLRLPINEALDIVLEDLEIGCAEINRQVEALSAHMGPEDKPSS